MIQATRLGDPDPACALQNCAQGTGSISGTYQLDDPSRRVLLEKCRMALQGFQEALTSLGCRNLTRELPNDALSSGLQLGVVRKKLGVVQKLNVA